MKCVLTAALAIQLLALTADLAWPQSSQPGTYTPPWRGAPDGRVGGASRDIPGSTGATTLQSSSTASPAVASPDAETAFWQHIAQSTDAADFEAYLSNYPNGRFTGLARDRIAALARNNRRQ